MDGHSLDNIVVVLNEPQDLVNIAAVIRAMKNMGLSRLRLVSPGEFDAWRIGGIAHRSEDIVEHAEMFDSLAAALADANFAVAATARARTAHRNYMRPREVAPRIVEHAREGVTALVFGREDRGLENEHLDLCHVAAVIPTDPAYPSMNLAQAALVFFYEIFLANQEEERPLPRGRRSTRPATVEEMENTFAALEGGLHRIDFFKVRTSESVMRTVRTVLFRAEPDLQEAGILRAIGFEIGHYLDRLEKELGGTGDPAPTDSEESAPPSPDEGERMPGREPPVP